MEYKKLRIIITNRNTFQYMKKAIESIRQNEHFKNDIIIYDDNSTDESRQWIVDNSEKFNYNYKMINETCGEDYDRMGITGIYNLAVDESPYDVPIMLGHSDMRFCKDFDVNLLKHVGKKKITCCTRIEPPLHPAEPKVKYIKDFGMYPEDLNEEELDKFVDELLIKNKDKFTNGVFAPMVFFKSDWNAVGGINKEFYPQSKEDDAMWCEWKKLDYEFVQIWDSLVYHYTCRGNRFKDGLTDSEEWKASNKKNLANFQRIWKQYPRHNETHLPIIPSRVNKITLVSLVKNNEDTIERWLETYEPFVDEVILLDDESTDNTLKVAREYFEKLKDNTLVPKSKLVIINHKLNKDFGGARNFGSELAANDWIIQVDQDEWFDPELLNIINWITITADIAKQTCVAFPRKNFIDGVLVNDIPRNEQFQYVKDVLDKKAVSKKEIENNPDLQCRLHKKDIKWIRPVHEMLEPFYSALVQGDIESAKKVMVFGEGFINHFKSASEQQNADGLYETIQKGASLKEVGKTPKVRQSKSKNSKPKASPGGDKNFNNKRKSNSKPNLVYNSVLFTAEGISKHAREEIKELSKEWNVIITSEVPDDVDPIFKSMKQDIDYEKDDYVYFINQPPIRQDNPEMSLIGHKDKKNLVYFLAMEGSRLPQEWTDAINEANPKVLITPSTFCKDMFEESGVKVPIKVIPHGVDSETIKSVGQLDTIPDELKDKTVFLWAGTYRGTGKNDRKGFNIMLDAWEKFIKEPESKDCVLVLKVSDIYYQGDRKSWQYMIAKMIQPILNRVVILDDNLTDKDMYKLIKTVDCYVCPSLSEGFGMIALESLACGVPVIATDTSGMKDFLADGVNAQLIKVLRQVDAEDVYPYRTNKGISKFDRPSTMDLVEKLKEFVKNKKKFKDLAKRGVDTICEEYSWNKIVEQISKVLHQIRAQ